MTFPLPFDGKPHRWTMGLRTLDPSTWFLLDEHYETELAERRRLLTEQREAVFQVLPEAEAAGKEVLEQVLAFLTEHHPASFSWDGTCFQNHRTGEEWDLQHPTQAPLELAGRLVQEDLCVMQPHADSGEYHLTAACLCFPTRWRLAEKLGQPMSVIHGPVPGYAEQLNAPVNRFLERLTPERSLWRYNWSLNEDPTLFQPGTSETSGTDPALTAENAGEQVWVRVERQTLRRLPRTQAVLFTIRILQQPVSQLNSEDAGRLAQTLRQWPEELRAYKSFDVYGDAMLAYLDQQSGHPA